MLRNRFALIVFTLISCFQISSQTHEFFISPDGNDGNTGTELSPFATPQRARDAIRTLKKNGNITGAVKVTFKEGTYYLTETLFLEAEDSGTETNPIIWQAEAGKKVVLSGAKLISGTWTNVDGQIWRIDIPETKGWTRNPDVAEVYQQKPVGSWQFRQLFINGKRAIRARYPNKSAANPFLYATGGSSAGDYLTLPVGQAKSTWVNEPNAHINIVIRWMFYNQWNDIVRVDPAANRLYFGNRERNTYVTNGNWFWIEGVKSELDEAEEWYLDNVDGQLYYMPAAGKDPNTLQISGEFLNRIVYLKGDVNNDTHVKYVYFKGLEFCNTSYTLGHIEPRVHTDAAIMLENSTNCSIENCRFDNIGGYALWLHLDSKENIFDNNTVVESGGGGVLLTGARFSYMDIPRLYTPGEKAAKVFPILNRISNNTVQQCGKIRYYGGGVHLDSRPDGMTMSPGNYIGHNYFNDLSRNGVFAFRNQGGNVVEYNHIHNAMQATIDGACIHFATMNHLNAPNYILNNYLYDIWGYQQNSNGVPTRKLANGIYLDWATSNTTVKNNYIYNYAGQGYKTLLSNQNLSVSNNSTSATPITPPFLADLGPGATSTNGIDIKENYLIGSVVHYSDTAHVKYSGSWTPRSIIGFYNLFDFYILEAVATSPSEITYSLPITEDGNYEVSILYIPDAKNASNASIQVQHSNGASNVVWDMKKGDTHGFSLPIGTYPFRKNGNAKVTISNNAANGVVVANSVAFVKKSQISGISNPAIISQVNM